MISPRRAALFLLLALGAGACRKPASGRRVSIGIQVSPAMALVMVAKDQGLFEKQGLDVELKPFTAGKFALQALLGGSLDFAVCGDVPIALAALQGNDVRIVSQVVAATSNEVRVVVRRDGQDEPATSFFTRKKRKLATSFGGGPEFFTHRFLRLHGIDASKVEIISQKPEDMPAALASGGVDAISVFDPFAFIAQQRLGPAAAVYRDDRLYSELYVLAGHPPLITAEPSVVDGILRALTEAEVWVQARPDDAKSVVARYTKLDRSVLDGIWNTFEFRLALRKQLVEYWAAEEEWARETGKVQKSAAALRFDALISTESLKRVDPSAVSF